MKRLSLALLLGLVLVAGQAVGEPAFKSLSVSDAVATHTFAAKTQTVTLVSDGASTCYYRLFTNQDTPAAATTAYSPIKSGETITYTIKRNTTDATTDSESGGTAYKTLSAICSTGQTATWRVYSK